MPDNQFELPKIGLRNIKTALGIFICILLYDLIGRPHVFFACISVVTSLQETMRDSLTMSKDMLLGTIVGGLIGIPFLALNSYWHQRYSFVAFDAIIISMGIVLVIFLCNLLQIKMASRTACVVFLSVLISLPITGHDMSPAAYALNRMLDSAVGVSIALLVNKYIYPFEEKEKFRKKRRVENIK